jgi:hypothetical protein
MSYFMSSLRQILTSRPREQLHFDLGSYRFGSAFANVSLTVYLTPIGHLATVTAEHTDPEGSFSEAVDVSHVLDRVGEESLDLALSEVVFPSGITAAVARKEDFAAMAPEILSH